MNPELAFVTGLSEIGPEKSKVASALEEMSIEELQELIRSEEAQEKLAGMKALPSGKRGLNKKKVLALAAGAAGAAGAAYAGTKMGGGGEGGKNKKASADEVFGMADDLGRELARDSMEKLAETEKERARRYGRNGALGYAGLTAANALTNPHLREVIKKNPGVLVGATALNGAVGYGGGRLVHRIAHGPATDKKVKKAGVGDMLRKGVGTAANMATRSPLGTRMAVGAAAGGLATGDVRGAAAGAAAGAGAKRGVQSLARMKNEVGDFVRQGMKETKPSIMSWVKSKMPGR
jgi:hypothetical protein